MELALESLPSTWRLASPGRKQAGESSTVPRIPGLPAAAANRLLILGTIAIRARHSMMLLITQAVDFPVALLPLTREHHIRVVKRMILGRPDIPKKATWGIN